MAEWLAESGQVKWRELYQCLSIGGEERCKMLRNPTKGVRWAKWRVLDNNIAPSEPLGMAYFLLSMIRAFGL